MRDLANRRRSWLVVVATLAAGLGSCVALPWVVPADWGAAAIVHPYRKPVTGRPALAHEDLRFESGGERLEGWVFRAARPRGTVVYLHGIGDNRESGVGVAQRLVPLGYTVVAFDSRAHGRSTGSACSYGYHERVDVSRALDTLRIQDAILLGHSLGAAIALETAAVDGRVSAVIAASSFSDLRSIVVERAAWMHVPAPYVARAIARAGQIGGFPPDEASPVAAAPRVRVPVLLLHGAQDRETPPSHSLRIAAALGGPHELKLLEAVGHDEVLGTDAAWLEIERFLAGLGSP